MKATSQKIKSNFIKEKMHKSTQSAAKNNLNFLNSLNGSKKKKKNEQSE